jgi:hypothetical protein
MLHDHFTPMHPNHPSVERTDGALVPFLDLHIVEEDLRERAVFIRLRLHGTQSALPITLAKLFGERRKRQEQRGVHIGIDIPSCPDLGESGSDIPTEK